MGGGDPWGQAVAIANSGADVVLLQEATTFDEYMPGTYADRLYGVGAFDSGTVLYAYRSALEKVEAGRKYDLETGVAKVKEISFAKFDETVELTVWLGVDPRKADQLVRGTIVLPHGIGKSVRVLVFCQGDNISNGAVGPGISRGELSASGGFMGGAAGGYRWGILRLEGMGTYESHELNSFTTPQFTYRDLCGTLRTDLNAARSSPTSSSGCSHAAKWPPLGSLL